ncbi:hypothetical protein HMPREF0005_02667 [Achromobacter xylosoxidans C54]|nr:hypothetical protein HMPREF0005_02667 [Achromobacter xylosoxidans C54]
MLCQLARGPFGRRAPFGAVVGRLEAPRRGRRPLGIAPLRDQAALFFEGAQQAPKTRRQIGEAGQHQLPGNGQPAAFERPQHPRITLVRVFGVDGGQRLAVALAPAGEAAVLIGIGAGRHLQCPFVHQQVGVHRQAGGLAGIEQHALGFFGADGLGPDQLRGEAVEAIGRHVLVVLERQFVGGLGQPGGQGQDARQFADLAFLAQQPGQLEREPARQAVVDRQHQQVGGGHGADFGQAEVRMGKRVVLHGKAKNRSPP